MNYQNDRDALALASFDIIQLAVNSLIERMKRAGMPDDDMQLVINLLDLQAWAFQAANGERVNAQRGQVLIDAIRSRLD